MKTRNMIRLLSIILAVAALSMLENCLWAADQPTTAPQPGVEVLTRGPIHEAYAEPTGYNPAQGMVVPKAPPKVVEEIPPAEKPQGENVEWIPGYWSWDNERNDFIWVSGIWRQPPPERSWVPGYWSQVPNGWTWTPGFWAAAESGEVEYLPEPPESLEAGPSSPAPSPDSIWTPGCWVWTDSRYSWRPGYWVTANPDWIREPAHYIWTPRGCVFSDGYWDWEFERRGVLFAPVYFDSSVYSQPGYSFTPLIGIQCDMLWASLFCLPHSHHYFFGDYYGDDYARRGFYPWFDPDRRHRDYDPIFSHERWRHERIQKGWERNIRDEYTFRQAHPEARPARNYVAQKDAVGRAPEKLRGNMSVGAPLHEVAARNQRLTPLEKISPEGRQTFVEKGKNLANYREQRAQWEAERGQPAKAVPGKGQAETALKPSPVLKATPENRPGNVGQQTIERPMKQPEQGTARFRQPEPGTSERVRIPQSPVIGRTTKEQSQRPPERPKAPEIDRSVRKHQEN